jgi:hypothetical protein
VIIVEPTADQLKLASDDAKKMGCLPNSFTKGQGNLIGMLSEIVAAEWLKAERVRPPIYSHDLVFNGRTIDVKCKRCSTEPLPEYSASVVAKDGRHGIKADILLFTRALADLSAVYLCGWLTTRQFARRSEKVAAGTRDGGFIHRVTGFHVPISRLNPMESLLTSPSVSLPL